MHEVMIWHSSWSLPFKRHSEIGLGYKCVEWFVIRFVSRPSSEKLIISMSQKIICRLGRLVGKSNDVQAGLLVPDAGKSCTGAGRKPLIKSSDSGQQRMAPVDTLSSYSHYKGGRVKTCVKTHRHLKYFCAPFRQIADYIIQALFCVFNGK